jgi:hypothetical protein
MYINFPSLCSPICVTKHTHCNKWATGCELEKSVNHNFITPWMYDEVVQRDADLQERT